jgi:uncharacterized protein YraI
MRDFHVITNGWKDTAQQFTTFPDGTIATGRSMELTPSGIKGFNTHAICIEHFGNFDKGKDSMTKEQAACVIRMTAALCKKFNIPVDTDHVVYHHWFDLGNGKRLNGGGSTKTCPGTAFFGGNKVEDAQANFLPKVKAALKNVTAVTVPDEQPEVIKYAVVTATTLNIRKGPGTTFAKVSDREAATFGSLLRVYQEKFGWLKISASSNHWVNAKYTSPVQHAFVKADSLNIRIGPGTQFDKSGALKKGEELFVYNEENGWCQISAGEKWVNKDFLTFN